jgi:hypothetical protein
MIDAAAPIHTFVSAANRRCRDVAMPDVWFARVPDNR